MKTIHTTGTITDSLELISPSGDTLNITFSFAPGVALIKRFRELQIALAEAKEKPPEEAAEAVGRIALDLFAAVFGKANTDKIVEFYAGRYEFMVLDLAPYISDDVIPKCRDAATRARRNRAKGWR